jgi:hypothetical protein
MARRLCWLTSSAMTRGVFAGLAAISSGSDARRMSFFMAPALNSAASFRKLPKRCFTAKTDWQTFAVRDPGGSEVLELDNVSHVYPNGTWALDHVTLSILRGMTRPTMWSR